MTERKKDVLFLAALLGVLILFYCRILFTNQIIRAPDILNEFYWGVSDYRGNGFWNIFRFNLQAGWDFLSNSGMTTEGGQASMAFLLIFKLIFYLFPPPASVAWFIVLHLFFAAVGVFCYCRLIGTSRLAALFAALVFALATENASLINAGHVMKIATISFAPWAFFCLEKGFLSRRLFWFMATAFVLAFQFFNTHWQIAFYTCLCVGMYGVIRTAGIIIDRKQKEFPVLRLLGLNLVVLAFFLTTVSISLLPLANWSKDTNRGVNSGANQGKGGLEREEAMSWSLPPEELISFAIPGFFGFSRQESGLNPSNISSYYWGRMVFTQTASYMGLLPWLLIPLPLIFRRDKYTWLAVLGIAGGVLFSMGKYTLFYNFLYDYFPGINRFRVPKMMMFIPVFGLGVLSARGIDLFMNEEVRAAKLFRRYQAGVVAFALSLLLFLGILQAGRDSWISMFIEQLIQPTRYEQGSYLVMQRWNNLMQETSIATVFAAVCAGFLMFGNRLRKMQILPIILMCIFLVDVWRVNDKFQFLIDVPVKNSAVKTPVMEFIARDTNQYRTLPMDGDPMHYASNGIPVMFTSFPVQQRRWQEYLDSINLNSAMLDILNVKYLVFSAEQYAKEKATLSGKFQPVFKSPDGSQIVLENQSVLPKAWLVPAAFTVNSMQALAFMQNPAFNPRQTALVEAPPQIPLANTVGSMNIPGTALVDSYSDDRIELTVRASDNALLVLGEKYYNGWKVTVDGRDSSIVPVDYILRGVYLTPGKHTVKFVFDPLPFKIGKYLTLGSFALFVVMLVREWLWRRRRQEIAQAG